MLGEALRVLRIFHDLAQKDLAAKLEIAPSYLSEIESGKKEPPLHLLRKYSEQFRIPMSSILFFSEHLNDSSSADRLRLSVSSKVLSLLKFIAARSGREVA